MSKYIDLKDMIHAETRDLVYLDEVREVLEWLDENPDQTPGRTITESEFDELVDTLHRNWAEPEYFSGALSDELENLGITVVPAPEPTNAEKLADVYRSWYGGDKVPNSLIRFMDEAGVTAPEEKK